MVSFSYVTKDIYTQFKSKVRLCISKFHLALWKTAITIGLTTSLLFLPLFSHTAFAYDRNGATGYADEWALSRNFNYNNYGEDCTNFVSQALSVSGGNYTQVPGNKYSAFAWWYDGTNHLSSLTWVNAPDNYNFQMDHYPGGWLERVTSWSIDGMAYKASFDAVNQIQGDVLYYDWDGSGISHAALQVNAGYSQYMPSGQSWYADLSDQHTTDRYHVSWSHLEVNPQWPTTLIYEVHIDDRN